MYKIIGADQQEYGPISADQIRQWVAEGRANGQTKVCAEGTQDWKPLSAFPELASIASSPAIAPGVAPAKPPGTIKVFGILNIVFGGLALLCSPFSFVAIAMSSKQMGYSSFMMNWIIFSVIITIIGGAILLASGVGLLKMKEWARKLAVYYAVFACIMPIISALVTFTHPVAAGPNPEFQKMAQSIGAVVGIVIAWTYNGLLIYFLTKPAVKEALAEKTQRV
ncbi:MAG TPA: DUF4339 domain-containing protein [Candidatus Polarisedimenticolia bacterium]|nr:DUF4339 domain-containing protein [Candidatus Polarisedimenticolia bacterium]